MSPVPLLSLSSLIMSHTRQIFEQKMQFKLTRKWYRNEVTISHFALECRKVLTIHQFKSCAEKNPKRPPMSNIKEGPWVKNNIFVMGKYILMRRQFYHFFTTFIVDKKHH